MLCLRRTVFHSPFPVGDTLTASDSSLQSPLTTFETTSADGVGVNGVTDKLFATMMHLLISLWVFLQVVLAIMRIVYLTNIILIGCLPRQNNINGFKRSKGQDIKTGAGCRRETKIGIDKVSLDNQ